MKAFLWISGVLTLCLSLWLTVLCWQIYAINGSTILDFQVFGRDKEAVDTVLSAFKVTPAADIYETVRKIDLFYPFAYGAFGSALLYALSWSVKSRIICLSMVIAAGADVIENALLTKIISDYPGANEGLIAASSLATQVKFGAFFLSMMLLAFALVKRKGRRKEDA